MFPNLCKMVSIPQRDFGEFQRRSLGVILYVNQFQSLKGILVNFNWFKPVANFLERQVSIPQRDFGEFQLARA
ncbi:Epoxyqueuosine (oQ) reductase QueG [Geitlerinema sp. FC II]|nr:Epoxyqueuosine (oQ) reductase QueG [Geitlerinema sp. FC II]